MEKFLDQLASKSPTPGGGSVSALMGALGFALLSMVCHLTIGKERYREVEEEMRKVMKETEEGRKSLTTLAREDAKAFEEVMAAYRMPKGQEEREPAIQKALLKACQVPLDAMRRASRGLHLAEICALKGNRNALSDVGVGALALQVAARGAALNIQINLTSLKENRKEIQSEMEEILGKTQKLAEKVVREVEESLTSS